MRERSNPSARAQKNTTNLSHLSLKLCVELREDLITWVCLELNARTLVSSWKVENLDDLNVGWLGVFITPTTKLAVCCRRAHRTVRCATGHCPVRQPRHLAVGFRPLELCIVGPPGCPVAHWTSPVDCPVCHPRVLCPLHAQARI
jgi:hypothetical protein